jgi:AcrR family transcriptional regulator
MRAVMARRKSRRSPPQSEIGDAREAKRQKRSTLRRSKIIDSSTLLFAERGFDGVALRDIVDHAGMPLSTLRHHFPSKKALYDTVVTRAFERTSMGFLVAYGGVGTLEAKLHRMIQFTVDVLLSGHSEMKLIDRALLDGHIKPVMHPSKISIQARQALKGVFCEVLRKSPSSADWTELSEIYVGLAYGVLRMRPLHAQLVADKIPSTPARLTDLLFSVFLNGIKGIDSR